MKADIARERTLFLKELGSNVTVEINDLAKRLQIDSDRAWDYLRSFLSMIASDKGRGDYAKIKKQFNIGVEPAFELDDNDIEKLASLATQYPALVVPDVVHIDDRENFSDKPPIPATAEDPVSLNRTAVHETPASSQPNPNALNFGTNNPPNPPSPQPYGSFDPSNLNRGYDYGFFSELTRVGLMRWVLQNLPQPPSSSRIEAFIRNFELNQDNMMVSSDTLTRVLMEYFGEKTGHLAGQMYNSNIQRLPTSEGFGKRKLEPQMGTQPANNPFASMSQFSDPYNTYYHQMGVLGFGMHVNSPDARRAIYEYEQEKREEIKRKKARDELIEDMRTKMQMQMSSFFDSGKNPMMNGGDNAGGLFSPQMMPILMSMMQNGTMAIIPYTDAEGKSSYRLEPRTPQQQGNVTDPNQLTARDLIDFYARTNETANSKKAEAEMAQQNVMMTLFNTFKDMAMNKPAPHEELLEMVKIQKEIMPQNQLPVTAQLQNTLDYAKVMLESKKFEKDTERADKVIDRQFEEKMKAREFEMQKEIEANKSKNTLIKSISNLVAGNLPVLFQLFLILTGRANPNTPLMGGGGGSDMMGGLGSILSKVLGGQQQDDEDEDQQQQSQDTGGLFGVNPTANAQKNDGGFDLGAIVGQLSGMFGGGVKSTTGVNPTSTNSNPTPQPGTFGVPSNFSFESQQPRQAVANPNFRPVSQINQDLMKNTTVQGVSVYDELAGAGQQVPWQNRQVVEMSAQMPQTYNDMQNITNFVESISGAQPVVTNTIEQAATIIEEPPINDDPYPLYTESAFEGYTKEQLQQKLEEAKIKKEAERQKYNASLDSYIASLEKKLNPS